MAETKMRLVDWLDDLCVRFIINLPREELESAERICFQVEEAQWFYEDFVRPTDPTLPAMNLKQFCLLIFQHCPLLANFSAEHHLMAYEEFLSYKTRVPVRGAIILNEAMDQVLLVKGWKKSASWSFPRGKINKDERDLDCAVREVYEETGYDLAGAGHVHESSLDDNIEMTMKGQNLKLFIFKGVPMEVHFEPRTRKEISKIQWYKLANLPGYHKKSQQQQIASDTVSVNKLYMVTPFMGHLKKWIARQKRPTVREPESFHQIAVSDMDGHQQYSDYADPNLYPPQIGEQSNGEQAPSPVQQSLAELDPATRLKQLLSVNSSRSQGSSHTQGSQKQAVDLLDMLRRGTGAFSSQPRVESSGDQGSTQTTTGADVGIVESSLSGKGRKIDPLLTIVDDYALGNQHPTHQSTQLQSANQGTDQSSILGASGRASTMPEPTSAPQLSPSKLDDHAMNLLNSFKTMSKPAGSNAAKQIASLDVKGFPTADSRSQDLLSILTGNDRPSTGLHESTNAPITRPSNGSSQQTSIPTVNKTYAGAVGQSLQSPVVVKPSTHASSLLNLFRPAAKEESLSAGLPIPPASTRLTPSPVELSAIPSPVAQPRAPSNGEYTLRATETQRRQPASRASPITSATLTGPMNTPDMGTVRRKPRTSRQYIEAPVKAFQILKRPVDASLSSAANSASKEVSNATTHMRERTASPPKPSQPFAPQILARPRTESKPQSSTSIAPEKPVPSSLGSFAAGSRGTSPAKPLQILKRPQPTMQTAPSTSNPIKLSLPVSEPTVSPFDRRASTSKERKQSLLNLFGGLQPSNLTTATAGPKPTAPSISSVDVAVVSPTAEASVSSALSGMDIRSPPLDLSRSRINSIASAPRTGSTVGLGSVGTRPQTPMSPQDRGFLMEYLESVVKGASR